MGEKGNNGRRKNQCVRGSSGRNREGSCKGVDGSIINRKPVKKASREGDGGGIELGEIKWRRCPLETGELRETKGLTGSKKGRHSIYDIERHEDARGGGKEALPLRRGEGQRGYRVDGRLKRGPSTKSFRLNKKESKEKS